MTKVYLGCDRCREPVLVELETVPEKQWKQPQEYIMNKYILAYCYKCMNKIPE